MPEPIYGDELLAVKRQVYDEWLEREYRAAVLERQKFCNDLLAEIDRRDDPAAFNGPELQPNGIQYWITPDNVKPDVVV